MRAMAAQQQMPARPAWAPPGFVPLPENRSALLAVRRLAAARRCPFHPLLLHGPPGTGKSHLAAALHDFRGGVRRDAADWPDGEARDADLLVVEDVQHLPERFADDFTAVLDDRLARRKATLLTANRGPADLKLPARLASRLAGGLVVGLEPLGRASRRRLLELSAQERGLAVGDDLFTWLAGHLPGSGRPLLAALDRIETLGPAADLLAVQAAFQIEGEAASVTVERITQHVSRQFQVKPQHVRGKERTPQLLWPRQVSMYLARRLTGQSLAQIGQYFERDHSTVRHACQKVEEALTSDAELPGLLRQLQAELG